MRFVLVPFAAMSLTACLGVSSEPLSSSANRFDDQNDTVLNDRGGGVELARNFERPALTTRPAQDDGDAPAQTEEEQQRQAILQEIALTIGFAADVSYDAAEAGLQRDLTTAQAAAADAYLAAETIQQRAFEAMNASSEVSGSGGCGGEVGGSEPAEDPVLDEAILTAFNAASATGEIASELDPPDTTVCGVGCEATCETVPGEVDQVALDAAIEDAVAAGDDCAALEEVIAL